MTARLAVAVAALLLATGCGSQTVSTDPPAAARASPSASPSSSASTGIRVVEEDRADLVLWVSNQSFIDDDVHLTVTIDGTVVADRRFPVENQHNWVRFPLGAPAGRHVLHVVSGTGVTTTRSFTLPGSGTRYAVVDYWHYADKDGKHIDWRIQNTPIGFA